MEILSLNWDNVFNESFIQNLAAGFVIFTLEILLVALLLPRFLQRRAQRQMDERWKPARDAFREMISTETSNIFQHTAVALPWNPAKRGIDHPVEAANVFQELEMNMRQAMVSFDGAAAFTPCFTPEMTGAVANYLGASRQMLQAFGSITHAFRHMASNPDTGVATGVALLSIHERFLREVLASREQALIGLIELSKDDRQRLSLGFDRLFQIMEQPTPRTQ